MRINHFKNKILNILIKSFFIFGVFLALANVAYAIDTYAPLESITIGEFIYNDDYTPTADDCKISIYSPSLVVQVDDQTMTDEGTSAVTGWHYYTWTTLATEGKYPAFITCGSSGTGDLFKLDKTFIVKAPVVTDSSIAAAVDANTSSDISGAVTTINGNTDTKMGSLASTLASLPADVWSYSARTLSSFGSLVSDITTAVWGSTTRSLSTYGTLVADVWNNGTRTITSGGGGATAADIWSYGTRNLTDNTLSSGSLAKVSDLSGLATATNVTTATSGLATSAGLTSALSPIAKTSDVTSSTGTITGAISALNNLSASQVWDYLTSNISTTGSIGKLLKDNINATISSRGTSTLAVSDLSSLATSAGLTSATSGLATAASISALNNLSAANVWSYGTRNLTDNTLSSGSLAKVSDLSGLATATNVTTATSTITGAITTATSPLATSAGLTSAVSPLATSAGLTSATSSLATAVGLASTADSINLNTNNGLSSAVSTISGLITNIPSNVWAYTTRTLSSFGTLASDIWSSATRTLTSLTLSSASPWSVTMSGASPITAGDTYLTTVNISYNGTQADSLNTPTITIYDANRQVVVNNVNMTRNNVGSYGYSYITSSTAATGNWESVISATVETGKTLPGNHYWNVVAAGTPQVLITGMNSLTLPNVSANIRITNEGDIPYEYQYIWCVVSNFNNSCGGGDDLFYSSAYKRILPGENFDTTLSAVVGTPGNYYFKVVVPYGVNEKSGAVQSFTAIAGAVNPPSSGGGGGGGGGGGSTSADTTVVDSSKCGRGNFNCDGKVNSIDFSILLYFWKTKPPFKNEYVDINKDGKVDSIDFSILLYQWGK